MFCIILSPLVKVLLICFPFQVQNTAAWTLFQSCFIANAFVTESSSLFRKMPKALPGVITWKLYSKSVLEQSEINQYRIPRLHTWIIFHMSCYWLVWCDTLVQLQVTGEALGIRPIVPARKNKAMWPGKMISYHCRILPAALGWSRQQSPGT